MGPLQKRPRGVEAALTEAAGSLPNQRTRFEYLRDVAQHLDHVRKTGEALAEGLASWKVALRSGGVMRPA